MTTRDLHADWARIGGGFSVEPSSSPVDLEALIMGTLAAAPADARLFWVAASWLAVHHNLVNTRRLSHSLHSAGIRDLAVAGAILSVAREAAGSATQLDSALKHCRPLGDPQPLFDIIAESPFLTAKARDGALDVFAAWGYWQDEISLRTDAIRPVQWVLAHCPEFRSRAILGAALEAEVVDLVFLIPLSVQEISEVLGVTYSAAHNAAGRLLGRGWLRKTRRGRRLVLALRDEIRAWYEAYPTEAGSALGTA
ncbi:MAG TPA: hypothetical protein VF092_25630 [Longimicrobium sp.]